MRLTELAIRNLSIPEKGQKTYWEDGFGVRVSQGGSKSFVVMHGKDRRLKTLGRWPSLSLKEARKQAKGVLAHPATPKPSQLNFDALRGLFLNDCEDRLRPKTIEFYRTMLSPYEDWPSTEKNPHRARALKTFAGWCQTNGYRTDNPYQRLKTQSAERDRVLTGEEIARLWHYHHPPYSDIVKLLILTGQRRTQIWKLQPDWVAEDTITFPGEVMKSGRTHIIPLTDWQREYLNQPFQFNGWSKSKQRMDKHTGVSGYVLHDIRRYFSTTMARLGVPLHVTEHLLDHRSSTSGVQAIYMRYGFLPEMREALKTYENHLSLIIAQGELKP